MNYKDIKYIGFYDVSNSEENRNSNLSATNKMDYIISKLNRLGYDVDLISPSWTNNNKYYKGKRIEINKKNTLFLPPTLPWKGFLKVLSVFLSQLWLFFHLLFYAKKDEEIVVYHSLLLMHPLYYAKKIKGFTLILEVEEVYQDVRKTSKGLSIMEYKLIKLADKYIFPTEMLNEKLNTKNKPYTIIYGTYQVEWDRKFRFNDDKIHVVYAGTFDPRKGGTAAVSAAAHLPKNYHVHIIGFGNEEQKRNIIEQISESRKISESTISYDGLLKGEEYIRFIQSCDIGLSTQKLDASFNNTSFPSKILSYMANGLRVVSVRIKAIELSAIGNAIYYYDEQTPEAIAKAIMSIDTKEPNESKRLIKNLDKEFGYNIKDLLEN
ncbi:glycosyltransferase [Cytobacillus firmus]|uniref:Glycosyltransferase n=1 Tax=Cytobacillus firmus TaxID=1399 RepID=A0AA46P0H2_CYTFI|nr:glycosyltransferase [Cytobacillus firmus]UYG93836.1 glycosyltransferase [Cytobacillus firmus]